MISDLPFGKFLTMLCSLMSPRRLLDGEFTNLEQSMHTAPKQGSSMTRFARVKMGGSHTIQKCNTDKTRSMPCANKLERDSMQRTTSPLSWDTIDTEQLDFELEGGVGWDDRWESTSTICLFKDKPPAAWSMRSSSKLTKSGVAVNTAFSPSDSCGTPVCGTHRGKG